MKNRIICLAAALCLLAGLLSACGGGDKAAPLYAERGDVERAALGELYPAADAETVLAALQAAGQRQSARWEPEDAGQADLGPRLAVSGDAAGDSVATDGSCIYLLDSFGLVVVSAAGVRSEQLSYTRVERDGAGWSERLYLGRDRVAIVSQGDGEADGLSDGALTQVSVLDVSDPRKPSLLARVDVEGSLVEACLLEDTLCLVTRKTLLNLPEAKQAAKLLPRVWESGKALTLRSGDVYLCPNPARSALTVVAAIRLADGRLGDAVVFTDGVEAVRAAGDALYLSRTRWSEVEAEPYREEPYTVTAHTATARTEIKRLRWDGTLTLDGGCVLDGALSDPAALDLLEGRLRVALELDSRYWLAYTDENHGWTNLEGKGRDTGSSFALLDEDMELRGAVTGLRGVERVAAWRFLGDRAWLTLPDMPNHVYVLAVDGAAGVTDVGGSLPADGDTLLLRAFGKHLALGLGLPASGGSWRLAMYDVTDPAAPKELDSLDDSSGAPAGDLTARGALFADPATGWIGWPAQGEDGVEYRLFRWTGTELREKGVLDLEYIPADARGLLLDGLLYVCSYGAVYVTDPETATVVATVSNTVG